MLKNWAFAVVAIPGADQKDCGLWDENGHPVGVRVSSKGYGL